MNLAALLSAAAASPLLPIPKHEPPAANSFPAHHETPPTRPFPSLDHADRGTKRKLSGWTAPLPVYPVQGTDLAMLDERNHAVAPPPPAVIVKSESEDSAPAEAVVAASQFARMGTRVPGSGDLGNGGARERMWPVLPGVSVGVRREEEELVLEEECYSWTDLPMNKQGFRYIPCGPSPIPSPSAIHPFYRRIPALRAPFAAETPSPEHPPTPTAHLDWLDRSIYLKLSPSAHTCTAEKGFRSIRGNVPVRRGAWYFECLVLRGGGEGKSVVKGQGRQLGVVSGRFGVEGGDDARDGPSGTSASDGAHVRIGWARREAPLNGPCGLDAYSYGIRDATGEKVTISRPKGYAEAGFGTGDVVGCLIVLPERDEEETVRRKRIPIRYKGQLYFESMEYTVPKEMEALVARDGRVPPVAADDTAAKAPVKKTDQPKGKGKQAAKAIRKKNGRKLDDRDYGSDSDADTTPKPRTLPRLPGSKISFYLNGKPMASSPAFEDIFDFLPLKQTDAELATQAALIKKLGALEASLKDRENPNDDGTLGYYPFISCFGGGKVQFNPGPEWMAPVDPSTWNLGFHPVDGTQRPIIPRPMSERWAEFTQEETRYDRADEDELTELLRKERAETAKKRVKSEGGSKRKGSTSKKASIAAALQASTPVSRGSSAVPSMSGIPLAGSRPSAFLATMIQDRGTPGGTPAPDTPVHAGSPTQTTMSTSSPSLPIIANAPPQPYPDYRREATVSATSEDAPGEDDWSPLVENFGGAERVASDGPELSYGMEPIESLGNGTGQVQHYAADPR